MTQDTNLIDQALRNIDYAETLARFIEQMTARGFTITRFFTMPDRYDLMHFVNEDAYEVAYQALNYEHTNITFQYGIRHEGVMEPNSYRQTISVMLTGDPWCDVIPINDWTFSNRGPDAVEEIVNALRTEILVEDALQPKEV